MRRRETLCYSRGECVSSYECLAVMSVKLIQVSVVTFGLSAGYGNVGSLHANGKVRIRQTKEIPATQCFSIQSM